MDNESLSNKIIGIIVAIIVAGIGAKWFFNKPPVAKDDQITIEIGNKTSRLSNGATSILANDSDPEDGDRVFFDGIIYGPQDGHFQADKDGSFTYEHYGRYYRKDNITYSIKDNGFPFSKRSQASIQVIIKKPNELAPNKTSEKKKVPLKGVWLQVVENAPWEGRFGHASVVHQNKIWVIGGDAGTGGLKPNKSRYRFKSDIWNSADGKNWEKITSQASWEPRTSHASVTFKGKIWVIGGWSASGRNSTMFSDVWSSVDGKKWKKMPPPPWEGRKGHKAIVHENKIWIFQGVSNKSGYLTDVWNTSDGRKWEMVVPPISSKKSSHKGEGFPSLPGREDHTVGFLGENFYILAGNFTNDIWISNNGTDWQKQLPEPLWRPRQGHTSVVYNGYLWIIGGNKGPNYLNDVWYSDNAQSWQLIEGTAWGGRSYHSSVVFANKVWVIGGIGIKKALSDPTERDLLNDVWVWTNLIKARP